jgi:hypothetical protein
MIRRDHAVLQQVEYDVPLAGIPLSSSTHVIAKKYRTLRSRLQNNASRVQFVGNVYHHLEGEKKTLETRF